MRADGASWFVKKYFANSIPHDRTGSRSWGKPPRPRCIALGQFLLTVPCSQIRCSQLL
ncbi:MAG: hypothetical protein F6J98_47495 [Moorea sp. SIO4G2]|nr:hypothetical protein [Moorena sp. SIO4G2]